MLGKIQQSYLKFSERNAFNIEGNYYTYSQFAQGVSNVRAYLESHCSKTEKLIGIIAKQASDIETYEAIYGCLYGGFGYVPLNPANPLTRNASILEQTGIKTILCRQSDETTEEIARINGARVVSVSELQDVQINLSLPAVDENDIAYLLFTSGSTGVPKGVPITRENLNSFVDAFFALGYNVNENDRFLQMFELTFDFSVVCYTVPLCIGACVYTVPSGGVKYASVYMTLEEHEITFACMVPSMLTYLKPYFDEIQLGKMKYSLFCGEMLLNDVAEGWSKCTPNAEIINAYGPTEATVFCLTYLWKKENSIMKTFNDGVAIGKPMENMYAIVVDENLKILSTGEKGELCLAGDQLTQGYWKDPVKNSTAFFTTYVDGSVRTYYRTGDLAFKDMDGDFMFAGRIDTQIKVQGFRIELGEIEHHTREFTKDCNVAAVVYENNMGMPLIYLFVENFKNHTFEIEKYLKSKVPEYMIPAYFSSIPSFPLNPNGKIDRRELKKIAQEMMLKPQAA